MTTSNKIALVTGATRGIGFETVRQLAKTGIHTLLAGRDHGRAVDAALKLQAEGLPVEAIVLDVVDSASIAAAVETVTDKFGRLDILVNNAGVLLDAQDLERSSQSLQVWRDTFATNVFGLIEVTQAFLPLLKKSPGGRIVNVSSALGSLGLHADPASPLWGFKAAAYNTSKAAVNAWTLQLAHDLEGTTLKVNTLHPGSVLTDMNAAGDLTIPEGAETSVGLALIDKDGPNGTFTHRGETLPW